MKGFFSRPSEIISAISVVLNIILFIANILIVQGHRKSDISIKKEAVFYELTLLKSLREFFVYISDINIQYSALLNSYGKTSNKAECKALSEQAIAFLDDLFEKYNNETIPYIKGYSNEAAKNICKSLEDHYDATTEIFSKYSQPTLNATIQTMIKRNYTEHSEQLIAKVYQLTKKYCP